MGADRHGNCGVAASRKTSRLLLSILPPSSTPGAEPLFSCVVLFSFSQLLKTAMTAAYISFFFFEQLPPYISFAAATRNSRVGEAAA